MTSQAGIRLVEGPVGSARRTSPQGSRGAGMGHLPRRSPAPHVPRALMLSSCLPQAAQSGGAGAARGRPGLSSYLHLPPQAPGDPQLGLLPSSALLPAAKSGGGEWEHDLTPGDPNPAGPGRPRRDASAGKAPPLRQLGPTPGARGRPRAPGPTPARPGPTGAHTLTAVPAAAPPALLGQAGAPDQRPPRGLERVHGPLRPPAPPPKLCQEKLSARPGGARSARSSLPPSFPSPARAPRLRPGAGRGLSDTPTGTPLCQTRPAPA